MKKLITFSLASCALVLSACSSIPFTHKKIGIANPASEYCIAQHGKLKQLKDAYGNISFNCKLPNSAEKDEWDLYRETHA